MRSTQTARYVRDGVLFPYFVDSGIKEGIVTLRALFERDQPSVPFDHWAEFDALACFERHRELVEKVAREAYSRQAFWDDGRVHIVNGELPGPCPPADWTHREVQRGA